MSDDAELKADLARAAGGLPLTVAFTNKDGQRKVVQLKDREKKVSESWVKDEVKKILKEFDVYFFMPSMNGYGRAGIPDIIACYNGLFIAIECKGPGGKVSDSQQAELSNIHRHNGIAMVIDHTSLDHLRNLLIKLKSLAQHSIVPKHL